MLKNFYFLQFIMFSLFSSIFIPVATVAAAPECALDLGINPSSKTIEKGKSLSYNLTIKNVGQKNCSDASISIFYGSNEKFVSATPSPTAKTNYYWYIGKLNKGQTTKIVVNTAHDGSSDLTEISNEVCLAATDATDVCVHTAVNIQNAAVINLPPAEPVPAPEIITEVPATKEFGVWLWDSPLAMTLTKAKQLIDSAKLNNFNAIYLTIDDVIPTMLMSAGAGKTAALQNYNNAVEQFIVYANQKGIAVDALGGQKDWAKVENRKYAYAILDFAAQYNASHSNKFRNVQYDVEPYLLPEYETSKGSVLLDFVALTNELVNRNTSGTGLTMVIPHFYGSGDNWTPDITYGGKSDSTFTHLLRALDKQTKNSLIMMSYRNYAVGTGGTLEITNDEMKEASAATRPTKVIVAQETGNVPPSFVTFYGLTRGALFKELGIINSAYQSSSAFGGTAIHYIEPFLELR